MELYKVSSNITTKLLAHFALNIDHCKSFAISLQDPGLVSVRWVRVADIEGDLRFDYQSLIEDYSIANSVAQPDEVWDAVENNSVSFAGDSALSIIAAQAFIDELLTKEEMSLLSNHLASLGCKVESTGVQLPIRLEDAVPLLNDDCYQPFSVELGELYCLGIVEPSVFACGFEL